MTEKPFGWMVLDKPHGITSRDAVDRAGCWFPKRTSIGHTGTLDPLATGVLVIAVGAATRLAEFVQAMPKVYESEFVFGAASLTDDAEGPITVTENIRAPELEAIESAIASFVGEIEQTPPAFSAAKIHGRRAYAEARAGKSVSLTPHRVRVDSIRITSYEYPRLSVEVVCGKGTYIRSLARDLGAALCCGAYVGALRRTSVGPFSAVIATPWDATAPQLLPPTAGLGSMPRIELSAQEVQRLRHGANIIVSHAISQETVAAAVDGDGRLFAIVTAQADGHLRPTKVLL